MTARAIDELQMRAWQAIANVVAAHVTMLRDQSILDDDAQAVLLGAITNVRQAPHQSQSLQDMVIEFDERADAIAPPEVRGTTRVGRGTNDVTATVVRLLLREDLLGLLWAANAAREALIDLASAHLVTLLPAFSGGQPAQPTTFAHLLGALIAPLERGAASIISAFEVVNRSPMGAVSLGSTSLEIDPSRTADRLGLADVMSNSFDAVTATDHVVAALDASRSVIAPIARFVEELTIWLRVQPDLLQLREEALVRDPALPQSAAPKELNAVASEARSVLLRLDRARTAIESISFGPVVGPDADVFLSVSGALNQATAFQEQTAEFLSKQLTINRAVLANRAGKGLITSSDLVDFLMLEEQLPPSAAHAIAGRVIAIVREEGREASGITPELIDSAALIVLGRELRVEFEIISRYLAPRRFIERRALPGGPAPVAMRAFLEQASVKLEKDQQWQSNAAAKVREALLSLDVALASSAD
jgi:argininosuccinate lyase